MSFRFTAHALEEIARRGLDRVTIEQVLKAPAQKLAGRSGRLVYQSRVHFPEGEFLVRVIVDQGTEPPAVVTAYRTSRIAKYWRQP
ncbi:MAG: DUF4258 domain-containing protein [Betaproteobacteria bacterium]|nr:DUF4258 domain-containing protein [Betaproteobacteria bacterium]